MWLDEHEISRAEFAEELGVSRTYLDRLCRRERRPSLELAVKIEEHTDIPVSYWQSVPRHSED